MFPESEAACPWCKEPILPGEMVITTNGGTLFYHQECMVRQTAGSVAHQEHRCTCFGGTEEDAPHLTTREAARAAFRHFVEHGAVE